MKRPSVLAIGGFDPSGGAGILADVKTMEAHKVYAFGVCTGITFQNSRQISGVDWLSQEAVHMQIDRCLEDRAFGWAKIGVTHNIDMLTAIAAHLKKHQPDIKIIWDPVIKASSGRVFLEDFGAAEFERALQHMYLATPNLEEMTVLYDQAAEVREKKLHEQCLHLSLHTAVYLKGGHSRVVPGKDFLFYKDKKYPLNPGKSRQAGKIRPKHGSGCVFAASLTANLAREFPLLKACLRSKRYIEKFLGSDPGPLGFNV